MQDSITSNNTEEKYHNLKPYSQFSRIRSPLSSATPQFSFSSKRSKPTRSQPKLESVPFPQWIMPSLLDQQVWIHLKLTSSTLWTSQPRSSKVKSKSPRISRSVLLARKLKLQKPLFLRSLTWNHSSMVWELSDVTTTEPSFLKKSSTLIPPHFWLNSRPVSRTWLDYHWKPDMPLKLLFPLLSPTHSRTSLLFQLNQGTILFKCRYKIKEL